MCGGSGFPETRAPEIQASTVASSFSPGYSKGNASSKGPLTEGPLTNTCRDKVWRHRHVMRFYFGRTKGPVRPGPDTVSATGLNGFLFESNPSLSGVIDRAWQGVSKSKTQSGFNAAAFTIEFRSSQVHCNSRPTRRLRMHVGSILILATLCCYQALLEAPQAAAHAWL